MQDDLIAVTQADHAATKAAIREMLQEMCEACVEEFDYGAIVRAMAAHRQQAEDAMRERCARICEEFPLAEDHPDAGVLGCRDMEIATAIRATPPKPDRLNGEEV
ncbi:hypothetical protein [Sphingomonas melonis]|uniref:N-methylhydantoinase B/oxoprolinase/acetone carboxylase alpha subunit n=1 Tax=Sphingomonas melonis TaxID=152682 RepID=A0A7Y9FKT2_9SPHN|nr:hypothetical protein [Sphingomonas melonis]NYD88732.1 N-methylhydantoinase B/oxoprolinase/acetone carboxylase alpha subunit [Sphingomonas melonis]